MSASELMEVNKAGVRRVNHFRLLEALVSRSANLWQRLPPPDRNRLFEATIPVSAALRARQECGAGEIRRLHRLMETFHPTTALILGFVPPTN